MKFGRKEQKVCQDRFYCTHSTFPLPIAAPFLSLTCAQLNSARSGSGAAGSENERPFCRFSFKASRRTEKTGSSHRSCTSPAAPKKASSSAPCSCFLSAKRAKSWSIACGRLTSLCRGEKKKAWLELICS